MRPGSSKRIEWVGRGLLVEKLSCSNSTTLFSEMVTHLLLPNVEESF